MFKVLKIFIRLKDSNKLCIFSEFNIASRVKMITIENNLDTFMNVNQMKKIDNKREVSKYRFVNDGCTQSTIGGTDWKTVLSDTILYLRNSCNEKFTNFKTIYVIDDPITLTDITTSQKYKEDKWKSQAKQNYKNYKINNDTSKNPSVTEDKDPRYIPPKTPPFNYTKYR